MYPRSIRFAVLIVGLVAAFSATAGGTVYRCGSTYQDTPCPGATVVDAQPNTGVEVRGPSGSVVHSRSGDKARNQRQQELMNENFRNALGCGMANDPAKVTNNRIDCPAMKAQQDAKRLTPDYIKK